MTTTVSAQTVSAQAVEALAIGDRLRDGFKLIELLRSLNLDLSKIGEIGSAIGAVVSAPDLKGKIKAGLALAKLLASATATTIDDNIVSVIDRILANETVLDLLLKLVGGVTAQSVEALQTVEAQGFNIAMFLQVIQAIQQLLALIGQWRGK